MLEKGAAYDPHPFGLAVGTGLAPSAVEGFGLVPLVGLGLSYRWSPRWRASVAGFAGFGRAEGAVWQIDQIEWGVSAGVDWSMLRGARWDWLVGVQGGLVGAAQSGERADADRLADAAVDPERLSLSRLGFGPEAAVRTAFELHPFARLGFRLSVAPRVRWLSVAEQVDPRFGVTAQLSAVARL